VSVSLSLRWDRGLGITLSEIELSRCAAGNTEDQGLGSSSKTTDFLHFAGWSRISQQRKSFYLHADTARLFTKDAFRKECV